MPISCKKKKTCTPLPRLFLSLSLSLKQMTMKKTYTTQLVTKVKRCFFAHPQRDRETARERERETGKRKTHDTHTRHTPQPSQQKLHSKPDTHFSLSWCGFRVCVCVRVIQRRSQWRHHSQGCTSSQALLRPLSWHTRFLLAPARSIRQHTSAYVSIRRASLYLGTRDFC